MARVRPGGFGHTIGLRLALASTAVALVAVALLAGLTAVFAAADVAHLSSRERAQVTSAIAASAGTAWAEAGGWRSADLSPVLGLAARIGAQTRITDQRGRVVAASPRFAAQAGNPQRSAAVTARGKPVGEAVVRFGGSGLTSGNQALTSALLRAIAGAAGLAALVALLTGLAVARRISAPVERLIAVVRAMARGDRSARVGQVRAPGELRELAAAFDTMADTLDRQERLRREHVADIAHELRTPIAILQAGHEALLDGLAEPTTAELASLRDEVLRLARMVADLQTLAAAEAAALRLQLRRCDLADVAAGSARSLRDRFEAAGIGLERRLDSVTVLADPDRLRQVITNLLTNALKFTPADGQVTVRCGPAGSDAVLQVADTGVGIPADELPRVFDRFWRGQRAGQTSGAGIGLAVAAELVRALGGSITAASEPGRGTRMTVTLPRA